MDKEEVFAIALSIGDTCIDYPFEEDFETAVFRRKDNRKWFGICMYVPKRYFGEGDGREYCLNVKCPPDLAEFMRASRAWVFPAWHMNKRHWITVRLKDAERADVEKLIGLSHSLAARKAPARRGKNVAER